MVQAWPFPDGDPPPPQVVEQWLKLIAEVFGSGGKKGASEETIAVHCASGLGRYATATDMFG